MCFHFTLKPLLAELCNLMQSTGVTDKAHLVHTAISVLWMTKRKWESKKNWGDRPTLTCSQEEWGNIRHHCTYQAVVLCVKQVCSGVQPVILVCSIGACMRLFSKLNHSETVNEAVSLEKNYWWLISTLVGYRHVKFKIPKLNWIRKKILFQKHDFIENGAGGIYSFLK